MNSPITATFDADALARVNLRRLSDTLALDGLRVTYEQRDRAGGLVLRVRVDDRARLRIVR